MPATPHHATPNRATQAEKDLAAEIWAQFLGEKYDRARTLLDAALRDSNHPRFRRIEARLLLFEGKEAEAATILAEIIEKAWQPGAWEFALAGLPIGRAKILPDQKILFFPVRKCGCTSVLNMLTLIEGRAMQGEQIHGEDADHQPVRFDELDGTYADYFSCALVRAPMERIVSYHRGNIEARDHLAVHHEGKDAFYGVPTRPTLDAFLKDLVRYRQVFVTARNHTDPVSSFLGTDAGRYSWIGGLKDISELKANLAARSDVSLPDVSEMRSPTSASDLPDLPDELTGLYKDDFAIYGRYF